MREDINQKRRKEEETQQVVALIKNFKLASQFKDEFFELMSSTDVDVKFLEILNTQLKKLRDHKHKATLIFPSHLFEVLKDSDGICSMHVNTQRHNYRILYNCNADGTVLLLGFEKKSGKKRTDYSTYIPKAQQRLKEWKDNYAK